MYLWRGLPGISVIFILRTRDFIGVDQYLGIFSKMRKISRRQTQTLSPADLAGLKLPPLRE
jgi:hypothetical protein